MKIKRWVLLLGSIVSLGALAFAGVEKGSEVAAYNLDGQGLALAGYDPVSYFEPSGPVKGKQVLELEYKGAHYCFASAEHRAQFEADPERYLPVCGGWCAWAMLEGDRVEVNPKSYKIYNGKLLLFYDGFWGDTRKQWKEKCATVSEAVLYDRALRNWEKILSERYL